MLIENVDARISRALGRLKKARSEGHPSRIAERERQLDQLLDLRLTLMEPTCTG